MARLKSRTLIFYQDTDDLFPPPVFVSLTTLDVGRGYLCLEKQRLLASDFELK